MLDFWGVDHPVILTDLYTIWHSHEFGFAEVRLPEGRRNEREFMKIALVSGPPAFDYPFHE